PDARRPEGLRGLRSRQGSARARGLDQFRGRTDADGCHRRRLAGRCSWPAGAATPPAAAPQTRDRTLKLSTYGIGARLRRAWDTALRAAEVMSASPMEDLSDRVDRLEREVAAMKERPQISR